MTREAKNQKLPCTTIVKTPLISTENYCHYYGQCTLPSALLTFSLPKNHMMQVAIISPTLQKWRTTKFTCVKISESLKNKACVL
jgi:hypothetical protein